MAQGQHFKKLTDSDIDNIKVWAKEGFGLTEIANKLEIKVLIIMKAKLTPPTVPNTSAVGQEKIIRGELMTYIA